VDIVIPASEEMIAVIERNFESKSLDYKSPMVWDSDNKGACCSLVKDVLAFANTEGGYIVIGVLEADKGFELAGVTTDQAGSFESSEICRFVQTYSDPPINVRVQKVSHKGKTFVVLEIPRFTDTPHLCQKDYPGVLSDRTLYVRTDNNESAPIRSSADFRALVEAAIRNRRDSILSAVRAVLTGAPIDTKRNKGPEEFFQGQIEAARQRFDEVYTLASKDYTFLIQTVFVPAEFEQYRFTSNQLQAAATQAGVSFTGWPFLFIHYNRSDVLSFTDDGLESVIATQDFADNDIFDFWKLDESDLFYKRELNPYSKTDPPVISGPGIVRHMAEAINCMTRLYESLFDDTEMVTLRVTISGTRNRALIWDNNPYPLRPRTSPYIANKPELEVSASTSLADWRAGLVDHAIELAVSVMKGFHFDQPDREQMKSQIENLFARRL
jgi:hypothetical protein